MQKDTWESYNGGHWHSELYFVAHLNKLIYNLTYVGESIQVLSDLDNL